MSWDIISALIVGATLGGVFAYLYGWSRGWDVGYRSGAFHERRVRSDKRDIESAVRRGMA